jgi:hypothetical protein
VGKNEKKADLLPRALWLGTKMYPDLFADVEMKKVVRDFFKDFYGYTISDANIDVVLAGDDNTAMTR